MDYIKIAIETQPVQEWFTDMLASQLADIGFESFMETENGLDAFITEKDFDEQQLQSLLSNHRFEISVTWTKELIRERNWNEEWEKNYFKPLMIGDECVVRAPFHEQFPDAKYEIVIEPNMAFGTGNHETTSMMMEAVLREDLSGKQVLDMGCGTGILGILASMKGAEKITAIDISEWAFSGTKENAAYNNIKNLTVKLGDAGLLAEEKFDLIFANIQKNVLTEDMPVYASHLTAGGKIFLSGFYLEDLEDIRNSAKNNGLDYINHQVRKNWVVAVMQKNRAEN